MIAALAAWSARETYRVQMNDLGDPNARPVARPNTTGYGRRARQLQHDGSQRRPELPRRHPDDVPARPRPGGDGQIRKIALNQLRSIEVFDLRISEAARSRVQLPESK